MYRVLLLEHSKTALAKKCTPEELHVNPCGFLEAIEEWVKQNDDIIIFCHDLAKLEKALQDKYKVEIME